MELLIRIGPTSPTHLFRVIGKIQSTSEDSLSKGNNIKEENEKKRRNEFVRVALISSPIFPLFIFDIFMSSFLWLRRPSYIFIAPQLSFNFQSARHGSGLFVIYESVRHFQDFIISGTRFAK